MKVLSKAVSTLAVIALVAFAAGTARADNFLIVPYGPQIVHPAGLGTVCTVFLLSEPASMLLLGSGLAGIASGLRRRRLKRLEN
jgi:PEP-CTERM motif